MLFKVREYITYGPIDEATFKVLVEKRGKATTDKAVDAAKVAKEFFAGTLKAREFEEKAGVKPFFRLAPPRGGFERKGIKKKVGAGGALGERTEMKDLLLRML
jgi:large subunit ribosomal protein L30